nr:MAG TPA: hypothetical protein [Bacteriophage sp.]
MCLHFSQISGTSSCIHRSNVKDVILREISVKPRLFPILVLG